MWTPEFERFVAPATRRPQIWRILVGLLVILVCWIISTVGAFLALGLMIGFGEMEAWMSRFVAGSSPTGTLLTLFTFTGMALGTIAAGYIHGRKAASLIGRRQLMPFVVGAGAVVAVNLLGALIPTSLAVVENTPRDVFLTFLPLALIGLLLQTGAEELAFRGYLQTQLAARFRSPIVWMVLPSVLFGALHFQPGQFGANTFYVVGIITVVGLIAADLTRVTGGLGAAWGLHFANNCAGLLIVGSEGPLGGLALYRLTTSPDDPTLGPLMLLDMGFLLLAWALIRFWWSRQTHAT
ncbi:CPBP family intramembrane glutamic endopeptidase [Jannaschia pohangensis]|uniref:CAAX prenyl protease 2/Lysostaphin resistance protein A-like domain-containing protein n=1 Tax=Jannaschia pohangensis TaxID=390807 RepID=A0A1I3U434_9RHOB|nr:CPBP family intramembrane glutamic endopeptidase [Jannaschia pohangensis]SFJ77665.1 hypothetical protein SAMN04488095_3616 [Jannaschia pohangensis]